MSGEIIQAHFEKLQEIAQRFQHQAELQTAMTQRVREQFSKLENGGWAGKGSQTFVNEMNNEVFPKMHRLTAALETSREKTMHFAQIMRDAEEEASQPFRGTGGASIPATGTASPQAAGHLPQLVPVPPGHFNSRRVPFKIGKPSKFSFGGIEIETYSVDVDGKNIPVSFLSLKGVQPTGQIHTIQEISKGLAALPKESRALVEDVKVYPHQNPEDAHYAKVYGNPNFSSYMTAGKDGTINIYPTPHGQSQDNLDGSMLHETGHIVSMKRWGESGNELGWLAWRGATGFDGKVPSSYAQSDIHQDFAESYKLYHIVKGTPQEAAARKQFPMRFKMLDLL